MSPGEDSGVGRGAELSSAAFSASCPGLGPSPGSFFFAFTMVDILSQRDRSALMARITGKNTKPELVVRGALHALGYRFRLHVRGLPGSPDLVFPARRKVLFVHGCFWHAHNCQHGMRRPSTNSDFWNEKARSNHERDIRKEQQLREAGWDVATVWECETQSREQTWVASIVEWLGPPRRAPAP